MKHGFWFEIKVKLKFPILVIERWARNWSPRTGS